MSADRVVIVSDAHLGHAPPATATAFLAWLQRVPDCADHLVINGDLFEFWFTYRHAIPRGAFPTLAALSRVRQRGVRLTVVGGNHDRWGGDFWTQELGATYADHALDLELVGRRARLEHGDGPSDPAPTSHLLRRLVHHRLTAGVFRWVHPDLGLPLVERLARRFPGKWDRRELRRRSAELQAEYARHVLEQHPEVDLLVLGHTHEPRLEQIAPGRWYLNPGAWIDGYRYALLGPDGTELHQWSGGSL